MCINAIRISLDARNDVQFKKKVNYIIRWLNLHKCAAVDFSRKAASQAASGSRVSVNKLWTATDKMQIAIHLTVVKAEMCQGRKSLVWPTKLKAAGGDCSLCLILNNNRHSF